MFEDLKDFTYILEDQDVDLEKHIECLDRIYNNMVEIHGYWEARRNKDSGSSLIDISDEITTAMAYKNRIYK